jgi:hypothetical protein
MTEQQTPAGVGEGDFFKRNRAKIDFNGPNGCWEWTAGRSPKGYGTVVDGGKTQRTHRVAWKAVNGAIPDGLIVRHKCDNRPCCNPDHLELGTLVDNNRDRDERGRGAKGEGIAQAKLTDDDVLAIRAAYVRRSREFGSFALARKYGVSNVLISMVVRRKRWTHVPEAAGSAQGDL